LTVESEKIDLVKALRGAGCRHSTCGSKNYSGEKVMNTKANEIKRITLSLNFNDENEYRFFVQLRGRTYTEDLWDLSAVNSVWEEFTLGAAMGKALMRPLVQLDHATKVRRRSSYEPGFWRLHSPRKKARMAAMHAEVSGVDAERRRAHS
jgi:hypothetical protein